MASKPGMDCREVLAFPRLGSHSLGSLLGGNRKTRLVESWGVFCDCGKVGNPKIREDGWCWGRDSCPDAAAELEQFLPLVQHSIIQGNFPGKLLLGEWGSSTAKPCLVIRHHQDKFAQKAGKNDKPRTQDRELLCRCCFAAHPTRMRFLCYLPAWEKQQPHVQSLATILGL